jgi:LuxR family maltose regulon positive regulatory protein
MTHARTAAGAAPVLGTKLHAPRRRRGVVNRPRLTARFGGGRDRAPLTLLSAPAGFGKTTLLAEWLAHEERTAWLSIDPGDNDPAVFWTYVIAALQSVEPTVGATATSILEASLRSVEPALTSLLNDLDALDHDVVLVLDDYHVIQSTQIHDGLTFLLEHLPSNVHLVIGSRADPPLPLPRLRARGELVEVRAADLRFTIDEAASYFNDAMGLTLTAHDVVALERRTEGWIAALQLAALSMQRRDDVAAFIDNFTGDDRFVVDYLVEEVLDRQPEVVRRFLLHTSILNRLTGSLCDAVTESRDAKATLETLERANLFLVPLDDHRSWYRYHHLFADVLRARLLDENADIVPELHRRASAWYESCGDRSEAIAHAMHGHDFERAAELIERATPRMRQTRQEATLRRWLEALPEHLFDARPVLSIALVGARMATGDTTGVESLLQSVESWLRGAASTDAPATPAPIVFDEDEFAHLPGQVAVYRAALALLAGDITATMSHANRVLSLVEPSDHLRRGAASALLGLAHWTVADLDAARRRYADAVRSFIHADHHPDVLGCSLALADIQLAQGRLSDAAQTFETGLRLTLERPGLRGAADMHVGLSEVLLERNELDAAAQHLEASRALGELAGLPQHAYRWRVAAARLRHANGDGRGALELLDEAERVYNTDFSPSVQPIHALRARVHLALGDLAAAIRWAHDRGLTPDDELSYVREFEHITLARILLAQRDSVALEAASNLIERLLTAADGGGRARSAIELLLLRSLAHNGRGDRQTAITVLEDALVRAAPEGYVRAFANEGPTMTALLHAVSTRVPPASTPSGSSPPRTPTAASCPLATNSSRS